MYEEKRGILTGLLYSCEIFPLILCQISTGDNLLKVSCNVESETTSMKLPWSATLRSIGMSCTLNGFFVILCIDNQETIGTLWNLLNVDIFYYLIRENYTY